MAKLKYTFKHDTLFKMLFVRYPDLLERLVADLLGIPLESIGQFEITNPEMPPESLGDKFCRLDINMTVDGQRRLPGKDAVPLGAGILVRASGGRQVPRAAAGGHNKHRRATRR